MPDGAVTNHILLRLPAQTASAFEDVVRPVAFASGQSLRSAGERLTQVYFVEEGLVSLMSGGPSSGVETCLVGSNGLIGASALLGARAATSTAIVRLPGRALVMAREDFDNLVARHGAFRRRIEAYLRSRLLYSAHSIFVTARCTIEQRLAGWLLTAQDYIQSDAICLTHECIAETLGVRRPGITVALHVLEGKQAIRSFRGRIVIRSRDRLRDVAGRAYIASPSIRSSADMMAA